MNVAIWLLLLGACDRQDPEVTRAPTPARTDANQLDSVDQIAEVHGLVLRAGQPAASAKVSIKYVHGLDIHEVAQTLTDAEGRYQLELDARPDLVINAFQESVAQSERMPIELVTGDHKELDIELTRASVVTGVVIDEHRKPVPFGEVRISCWHCTEFDAEFGSVQADGSFVVGGLQGGHTYRASVKASTDFHAAEREPVHGEFPEIKIAKPSDHVKNVKLIVKRASK